MPKLYKVDDGGRTYLVLARDRKAAKVKWVRSRMGLDDGVGLSVRLIRFPKSGVLPALLSLR